MRIRMHSKLALIGTLLMYPILYYAWVKQIKNSWVSVIIDRSRTISSTVIKIFFTLKKIDIRQARLLTSWKVSLRNR